MLMSLVVRMLPHAPAWDHDACLLCQETCADSPHVMLRLHVQISGPGGPLMPHAENALPLHAQLHHSFILGLKRVRVDPAVSTRASWRAYPVYKHLWNPTKHRVCMPSSIVPTPRLCCRCF